MDDIQSILGKYGVLKRLIILFYIKEHSFTILCKKPYLENLEQNIKIAEKPNDCLPLRQKSNERLEFLGDGVLECITKYYLYKRFSKENEGS